MNELAKQYVKEAKAFFPIVRKQEKKYLKQLELTIVEYCQRRFDILSIEKVYEEFGKPSIVACEYFSGLDMNFILKRMSLTRNIKRILIASSVIGLTLLSLYLCYTYKLMKSHMIFSIDYTIENVED